MVHRIRRSVSPSAPVSLPAPTVTVSMVDAPAPASPAVVASTMTREDVIHLQGMYGAPNSIRISVSDHGDRVTSGPEGGSLCMRASSMLVCLPFHPFILSLLDHYRLVPSELTPNAFRIICSIFCHFYGIVARFSLFRAIYALKWHPTKKSGWFIAPSKVGRSGSKCLPRSRVGKVNFSLPSTRG